MSLEPTADETVPADESPGDGRPSTPAAANAPATAMALATATAVATATATATAPVASPLRPPLPDAYAAWVRKAAAAPYAHDLFQALRHIESAHPHLPRLGEALRPADEPVRMRQSAEMTFAPAGVSHLDPDVAGGVLRLSQRVFGLLGPNGPLPLHMTELARERSLHFADPTLLRFLDMLSHRFALLFYRAWAQAQPVVSLDRPGASGYLRWLGSLCGLGNDTQMKRDAVGDAAKLHFVGRLARGVRDADGLLAWCRTQFDVPLRIDQWQGHWMSLGQDERTTLRRGVRGREREGQGLGSGAVLGGSVWDVQHKFRIVIGPLRLQSYLAFLPDGRDLARLQAMVRQWVGLEFAWDLQLILAKEDVPSVALGGSMGGAMGGPASGPKTAPRAAPSPIGRTAWLGNRRRPTDADDLIIDVERTLQRGRRRPPAAAAVSAA